MRLSLSLNALKNRRVNPNGVLLFSILILACLLCFYRLDERCLFIDEVLTLADGSMAPLDYKYTEYRDYLFVTHKTQSVLYAMLIKEVYHRPVLRGYICYARDGADLKEVIYKPEDFEYAAGVVDEIFRVVLMGYYPKKSSWPNRCIDCCYKNICV